MHSVVGFEPFPPPREPTAEEREGIDRIAKVLTIFRSFQEPIGLGSVLIGGQRHSLSADYSNGGPPDVHLDEPPSTPLPKLVPIPYIKGEVVPPLEWLVPDWIPMRKATLLQGDGGDGKSTIVQQLQSSCAAELAWLGLRVNGGVSLGVYTEDEKNDLLRRQKDIDANYNLDCRSTGKMLLLPRAGEDNELIRFNKVGVAGPTPFYRQVREAALDFRVRLVGLDVAVDLYGGDENDRRQVRAFARLLNGLAMEIDGAVVLSSHLSQAGIKSEGGHSGSTDWSNAFRSRAYLSRPKKDNGKSGDGDEPTDTNARLFTRKKANFASIGETIKLHWARGVILPDELMPNYFRRPADDVFLALLDAHEGANRNSLSESKNAGNYAPRVFGSAPASERDGYGEIDFKRAMDRLFRSNKIASVNYGRKGDERKKIARKTGGQSA